MLHCTHIVPIALGPCFSHSLHCFLHHSHPFPASRVSAGGLQAGSKDLVSCGFIVNTPQSNAHMHAGSGNCTASAGLWRHMVGCSFLKARCYYTTFALLIHGMHLLLNAGQHLHELPATWPHLCISMPAACYDLLHVACIVNLQWPLPRM